MGLTNVEDPPSVPLRTAAVAGFDDSTLPSSRPASLEATTDLLSARSRAEVDVNDGDGDDPADPMPGVGDSVGPYLLKRELGRGGFARVFLAEQTDLADRLVVLKFSRRPSREPWLLARARHPNIVPILSQAEVNDGDLQMIAMPFLGGATLGAVLGRRASAGPARQAARRLLEDLDAASAPELPTAGWESPARRLLEGMTDERALAWITARLAEALDHARGRGVAHGDVKPSNILLTAGGEPMLLDFNLARATDAEAWTLDFGGTPAYMAPERLAILLDDFPLRAVDLHRADLYALGLVLLEAITGWSPTLDGRDGGDEKGNGNGDAPPLAKAQRYARLRAGGGEPLVRRAEAAADRAISPALRSILVRCLQADPEARYDRGWKLAEDLDRWRADRPLAFAPEPARRHVLARWARRNRRGLSAAVVASCVVGLVAAVLIAGDWRLGRKLRSEALGLLNLLENDPQFSIFDSQRPGEPFQRRDPAEVAASALRSLRAYHLLDDDAWRERDAFRHLPAADRDDLELFLMEQTLRYGQSLADRPASPDDWRRAAAILDRAFGPGVWPTTALALRRRLAEQLAARERRPAEGVPANPVGAAPWIEAYLDGIAAELDAEARGVDPTDDGLDAALASYDRLLRLRPDSFWGRYRSAVIAFGRGRWDAAAADLAVCLKRRPDNPILHGFLATCLLNQGRPEAALEQCDLAVASAPDHAEFFQTRAFIRASSTRPDGLEEDIERYELLKRLLPPSYFQNPTTGDLADPAAGSVAASRRGIPVADFTAWRPRTGGSFPDLVEADPGELASRAVLASRIREAGLPALAMSELTKLLTLDPDYLVGRVDRLCLILDQDPTDNPQWPRLVRDDLESALNDPRLPDYARGSPRRLDALHSASSRLAAHGLRHEALRLAAEALEAARIAGLPQGRSYYTLAQVQAVAARTEDKWAAASAANLRRAIAANPDFETWFIQDPAFNPIRSQIRALLDASR